MLITREALNYIYDFWEVLIIFLYTHIKNLYMRLHSICIKTTYFFVKCGKSFKLVSNIDHLKIINSILVCPTYYTFASWR